MSGRLADPGRVRRLLRACRRTGLLRPRPWLLRRNDPADAEAGVVFRLAMSGGLASLGMLAARDLRAVQLLALAGILLMQSRIQQLRQVLAGDPALAVLAQLPVPAVAIFDHQLRAVWRAAGWAALDAAGFWAVAWAGMDDPIRWVWLPAVAAAHALLTLGMAFALVEILPMAGCGLLLAIGALAWGTVHPPGIAWLAAGVHGVMWLVTWLTPWGWLDSLAARMPAHGHGEGIGIAALAVLGVALIGLAHDRLRRTWTLDPAWREVAGRPQQAWPEEADDPEPEAAPTAGGPPPPGDAEGTVPALARARSAPGGLSLAALGWPGRRTLAELDAGQRWLADRLAPQGPGTASWRWALLLAALPAACAASGVGHGWGLAVLAAIVLARGMPRRAAFVGLVAGFALYQPDLGVIPGLVLPCIIALFLVVPFAGGTWQGLPMGCTVLGQLPRTWQGMLRIMVRLTRSRLLAAAPVVALVMIAAGCVFHVALAAILAAGWLYLLLTAPTIAALQLLRRTPGGILDLGLGRRLLTAANCACIVLQAFAAVALVSGAAGLVNGRNGGVVAAVVFSAGLVLSVAVSLLHVPLLRHAWRRRVDLIPPA